MNRLRQRMAALKKQGDRAFIAYIMAGDPTWDATEDIILSMEQAGVTAVELGVPFSDPIADGPVIQEAGNRALAAGVTLEEIFARVSRVREKTGMPVLLMGYWNVFLQYGRDRLLKDAGRAGIDGFIIADLPYEADVAFFKSAAAEDLCTVLLAAELTSDDRLANIASKSTGFIYYVPQLGITGLDLCITGAVERRLGAIKDMTDKPVCVGIGVKRREDVVALYKVADGVIVGTRIVQEIDRFRSSPDIGARVADLVRSLRP